MLQVFFTLDAAWGLMCIIGGSEVLMMCEDTKMWVIFYKYNFLVSILQQSKKNVNVVLESRAEHFLADKFHSGS